MLKQLKMFYCAVLFSILNIPVYAQQPISDQTTQDLMQAIGVSSMMQMNTQDIYYSMQPHAEDMVKSIVQVETLNREEQDVANQLNHKMSELVITAMNEPQMSFIFHSLIKKTYTENEAQAYIRFLKSPEGKSIKNKSMKMSLEANELAQQYMQHYMTNKMVNDLKFKQEFEAILAPLLQSRK